MVLHTMVVPLHVCPTQGVPDLRYRTVLVHPLWVLYSVGASLHLTTLHSVGALRFICAHPMSPSFYGYPTLWVPHCIGAMSVSLNEFPALCVHHSLRSLYYRYLIVEVLALHSRVPSLIRASIYRLLA
jgi:hypothetical protein